MEPVSLPYGRSNHSAVGALGNYNIRGSRRMATPGEQASLKAASLFSCEGVIALVTGGGTGISLPVRCLFAMLLPASA